MFSSNIKIVLVSLFALIFSVLSAQVENESKLQIGEPLPMSGVKMENVYEKKVTLSNLKSKNGLMVVFTSNKCPFIKTMEKEFGNLYAIADKNGIKMVLVNSNEKYRNTGESEKESEKNNLEEGYDFIPYIIDKDSKFADALGANTTPEVYIFDKENKLIYRGAIDDRYENSDPIVTKKYVEIAIEQYANNKKITPSETRNIGCSIKRK